jgi:hypothetical protein
MDLPKFEQAFINAGYQISRDRYYDERFNIPVLNEHTVDRFLAEMGEYEVERGILSQFVLERQPNSDWYEINDLCPALLIDFDQKKLSSLFPEPASFEEYVPDGWIGEWKNFLDAVPVDSRYWVINGVDYFERFLGNK